VAAPIELHKKLQALITAEISAAKKGAPARIVCKANALVDDALVRQLYRASQSGVQVDLIVRGPCSLIPGVKGLSENIRVLSVVDRYLEHSRFYYFAASKALYLSSADWMPRNFFSRLELAFPVLDPTIYSLITEVIIPAYLSDSMRARELTPQGLWKKRTQAMVRAQVKLKDYPILGTKPIRSQFFFEELASKAYDGTTWKNA
jgi:polyphosphate kinase